MKVQPLTRFAEPRYLASTLTLELGGTMIYHPVACYQLRSRTELSIYSSLLPQHDGDYEIHLVKASDPRYIPDDFEIWPIYQQAILAAIEKFPAASDAAYEAYLKVQKEYEGRKNRLI
jgi:hypothetical protein